MTDLETLAERVAAVERAVTDGESDEGLPEAASFDRRLAEAEETLADIDDRVATLESATQALRGYVGGVRAMNRDVERRADIALAKAEALEADAGPDPTLAAERMPLDGAAVAGADVAEAERNDGGGDADTVDGAGTGEDAVGDGIAEQLRGLGDLRDAL